MAAELQLLEAPITAGPAITTTTTTQPINTTTTATAITAIAATTTALPSTEHQGPQLGPKRQRRPSVRLGEIGNQPAATVSFDSHMRRAKHTWRLPKDSKSVKARSITNLVNGNDSNGTTPPEEMNQNGDGGFEFGNRRIKAKRATGTKRVRSNWASNSKLDDDGDSREDGGEWFSADPDQDSPVRDSSPVNSGDDAGQDLWEGQRRVAGNWARVSESRENDAVEAGNMPESNWSRVRSWLIELGLSRYTPVFEIHEVDDEVLPMLTLEDLKDMGINAVGSRRKMYSTIQKLRKGFSSKMESGFELCFPESEVYSARVNNLCVPSTVLTNFALRFSNEQMRRFRETCFGHLMELDKISFSGQMVHGLALRRVAGLGVKDIHGLSYAIGSNVVQFTAKVFCLISGLKFGVEPHITAEDEGVNRLLDAHISNKNHITLQDIEKAFLSAKFGSEDVFKLGMLCFIEFVILGKAPNVRINEEYLHLVHNMEELNNFPWGSISFEQLQDSLLFSPGKRESDENDDGKEKRQRKGKEEVKRKKKLEDKKHKRINRPAWTIKGLSFAFQHVSLRLLRPSALELRQKYWTWGTNFHEEDAPSMGPRVCTDLAEVSSLVQRLGDEIEILHREKSEQWANFVDFKNATNHGMEVMRLELIALRKMIGHGGGTVVVPSVVKVKRVQREESVCEAQVEDSEMKDEKLDDEEEREDEDEKGGEKVHAVENDKGDVEYITPEINWDDPALVCVTLVNFLKNPCRKWKVAMEEGDADDDVVVRKVQKKRGRPQSSIVEPAMKRPRSVECKTPWQRQEIPNIGEETIGLTFDPLRPVRRGLLLETAKFFWEWGQKENTHVRLCGKHGVDTSHDFFIRLLTKDGWLNDTNIDMGLYLLRVRQKMYANLVRSDWAIVDTMFQTYAAIDLQHMRLYGGKEDRTHSIALVKMVNGKLPMWGKPWSSVKKVFMPYNVKQKHWVGIVLDLTSCEIFVYDSKIDLFRTQILVKAVQPLAKLIPRLLEEAGYVGDFPLQKGEWPIHRVMDSAQQVRGGDCGIFVIKYCEFLSWNVDLGKISNEAMHLFRLKLTVDLLQGCYNI